MRLLINYRHFPIAIGKYFHRALIRLGHEVYSVGPFSGDSIPWGDYHFPKYVTPPHIQTEDKNMDINEVLLVFGRHFGKLPDAIIQAGDTIFLRGKTNIPNYVIATDPHAVDYTERFFNATKFFCMQKHYMSKGEWLPYAYDPEVHFPQKEENKYDVVLCGLQYEHRIQAVKLMESKGLKVFNALGYIFDEYREKYCQGKIAFNYSSKEDLPARFYEGMAMGRLMLTNRVPDLKYMDFKEDEDYVAYSTPEEMVEKAVFYATHDKEREKIAKNGLLKVKPHTYDERCKQILRDL